MNLLLEATESTAPSPLINGNPIFYGVLACFRRIGKNWPPNCSPAGNGGIPGSNGSRLLDNTPSAIMLTTAAGLDLLVVF